MPTNYSGRVITILVVLFAALWAIFPSLNPRKPDLKPGIDMVGGTSLLYEIKPPEGGQYTENLAEQVAASLKKRVDPDGIRNLIWRPQGNTRLEIQMPLTKQSGEANARRKAYAEAQRELESTNVRPGAVLDAVEKKKGDERRAAFERLAMGSEANEKLFGALASAYDRVDAARQKKDSAAQAQAELEYDKLKKQIGDTNLGGGQLESILTIENKDLREKRLSELREKYKTFPRRLAAIDQFVKAFDAYSGVKGSLDDASDLKRLLRGSGVLEFHILVTDMNTPEAQAMVERLNKRGPIAQAGDTMKWLEVDKKGGLAAYTHTYNDRDWVLAYTTPDKSMAKTEDRAPWALERAYPTSDGSGARVVGFRFDPQGGKYFGDLTARNINKPLAISLDDKIISAPNINSQIGRDGIIEGGSKGFSNSELTYLISTLNAGSLPARLQDEPISERTVGPQLGEDNLHRGLLSCVIGGILIVVFMIGYYYLSGVVACVALMMNIVLILGIMGALNATFTLPGVAAVVLTIGMAVDANVLIYERLREEMDRGLTVRTALRNAYDRAFSAIFDGNVTTAWTSFALYIFGSEEVKGFGLTLMIGIACSLFTALFVTKTIFAILLQKFPIQNLGSIPQSFPRWQKFLHPNFDWMGKAKYFYAFSAVFIIGGLACVVAKARQGQLFDIEFASGTSVQFDLKQPTDISKVRSAIEDMSKQRPDDLPAPSVVSVGTDGLTYEVVTPQKDAPKVKQAVLDAMGTALKLELPSKFDGSGAALEDVLGKQVTPIDSADTPIAGATSADLATHVGGVAIRLQNVNPPLRPSEIKERLDRTRLQPQPGQTTIPYRELTVLSEARNDEPATSAVILVSDPAIPHDQDVTKWQEDLVRPMWKLTNDAINSPPNLQKVTNFDAQVAGETQRQAFLALFVSVLGIMAYIWIRFGNIKYGTATVVALLHDVLFTVAALGYSHYVANTWFGNALLIEPFRVNLTIIAAVLTVMGYSMNDTVVVFDRIRENRGKFGAASRRVINDSINQTLSRTLLTSGCTLVTCITMYFLGGPGIHGFTYCLVLGILVGTYSSIAIAAPILLLGATKEAAGSQPQRGGEARKPAGQLQRA